MRSIEIAVTDLREKQISAEWKKPKDTSKCVVTYKAAVVGSAPWAERQFESVEKKEIVIGDSANNITDGLERAIEQVPYAIRTTSSS
jgi:hypothetical protein